MVGVSSASCVWLIHGEGVPICGAKENDTCPLNMVMGQHAVCEA